MSTQHPDPRLSACIAALRACQATFASMAAMCEEAISDALDGAVTAGDVYRISSDRVAAVSSESTFLPMDSCPISRNVILLGAGGVATVGQYDGRETFWQGWHPLPRRAG